MDHMDMHGSADDTDEDERIVIVQAIVNEWFCMADDWVHGKVPRDLTSKKSPDFIRAVSESKAFLNRSIVLEKLLWLLTVTQAIRAKIAYSEQVLQQSYVPTLSSRILDCIRRLLSAALGKPEMSEPLEEWHQEHRRQLETCDVLLRIMEVIKSGILRDNPV